MFQIYYWQTKVTPFLNISFTSNCTCFFPLNSCDKFVELCFDRSPELMILRSLLQMTKFSCFPLAFPKFLEYFNALAFDRIKMTLLDNNVFTTGYKGFDSLKITNKMFDILRLDYIEVLEVIKSLSLQWDLCLGWYHPCWLW